MADVSTIFNKTDFTCSNSYLIDETLCLANSLDIINSNTSNLSSAIQQLQNVSGYLNQVYTLFSNNSANWLGAYQAVVNYENNWNNDYTLVTNLSSSWTTDLSIYYTTTHEIQDWYTKEQSFTYSNGEVLNWLNANFPTSDYLDNQILAVYVNLYENYVFDMTNFSASYTHDCHVPNGSITLKCTPCANNFSHGCNHHGGDAGDGPCDNAFDHCSVSVTGSTVSFACYGTPQTLAIGQYSTYFTDKFFARNVRLRYFKNSNSPVWIKI